MPPKDAAGIANSKDPDQTSSLEKQSDRGQTCLLENFRSLPYEPRYEKTDFLHMRKQRRRSAAH